MMQVIMGGSRGPIDRALGWGRHPAYPHEFVNWHYRARMRGSDR
jgi:hypothetical protein